MTGTPIELLAECEAHGIRLTVYGDGGLAIDAPRDAMTPDLLARLKAHKADVLALLRPAPEAAPIDSSDPAAVWQAALDRLEGDPLSPPDLMEALRAADARWANDEPHGEPANDPAPEPLDRKCSSVDYIDAGELTPCPKCGTLELWQTLADNWRCLYCDPPTTARRLAELAARIRRRSK